MPIAPIIGITATSKTTGDAPEVRVGDAYTQAVERAGGVPVVLPPLHSLAGASRLLDGVGALLLTGGEDVDPARYGEPGCPALGPVHEARDATEIELVTAARERGLPLLGICRGVQILNVALGGSLVQDIPSQRPGGVAHDPDGPRAARVHEVEVDPGSRLARALGASRLQVNSFHHQAVDRVAEGLRVVAWAPDGMVEAIEWDGQDWWAVGVQWHPEALDPAAAPDRALFAALVEHAMAQP